MVNIDLLEVKNLNVSFNIRKQSYPALEDISFIIKPNQVVGIVGESGSGKSLTAQSVMGILPGNACIESGSMRIDGEELVGKSEKAWAGIRSNDISMVFQEPMTALNPLMKVGAQVAEVLKKHTRLSKAARKQKTLQMMNEVGLPRVESLYHAYPHELSGGMKQRIVIAMALINDPKLIIADEPTTALDVTIQAQVLTLFRTMIKKREGAMLFISHDWGVISDVCDEVLVMYAGRIVERGPIQSVMRNPQHFYTRGLLKAIPDHRRRGHKLYHIPLRVPALQERVRGEWPYLKDNVNEAKHIFPEAFTIQGGDPHVNMYDRGQKCHEAL